MVRKSKNIHSEQINNLLIKVSAGENLFYLPFWGPIPTLMDPPGKGCLCQWWLSPFVADGNQYATAEHYLMAGKARLFGDLNVAQKIVQSSDPSEAQYLGRTVRNYNEAVWAKSRYQIAVEGNWQKFSQHAELKRYLLSTMPHVLVSANPTDNIWSVGLAEDKPEIKQPALWRGLNLLGFALMEVRDRLLLTQE